MRILLSTYVLLVLFVPSVDGAEIDHSLLRFNRDVRQILADKCFHCHGPDANKREADLRLDRDPISGTDEPLVIVAGRPEASELYRRITSTDPDERMPPADQERQLSPAEIEILRRWIEQGGQYEPHWAFVAPVHPALPSVSNPSWPRNGIDYFVLRRWMKKDCSLPAEADKTTLLRRVTLDLTGLPPTPAEVDAFLATVAATPTKRSSIGCSQSPRYGERMALDWLDAARYADTQRLPRSTDRGHVAVARLGHRRVQRNLPFDQFTIEQLAGDLLPEPTLRADASPPASTATT